MVQPPPTSDIAHADLESAAPVFVVLVFLFLGGSIWTPTSETGLKVDAQYSFTMQIVQRIRCAAATATVAGRAVRRLSRPWGELQELQEPRLSVPEIFEFTPGTHSTQQHKDAGLSVLIVCFRGLFLEDAF